MTDEPAHNEGSQKQQRGVSLLELMAAIAILSAILAISVPMYQSYRLRAKIGDVWPTDNVEASAKEPTFYSNQYVDHSTVASIPYPGSITVSYNNQKLRPLGGNNTIVFYPVVGGQTVVWKCDEGTVPARYRPSQCSI